MNSYIPIDVIRETRIIEYSQVEIQIANIDVGKNTCVIRATVSDATFQNYKHFIYTLAGEEYQQWTDDKYLIDWVKNKISKELN